MNPYFPDPIHFEMIGTRNGSMIVRITQDVRYFSDFGTIVIPRDFKSDGASVPRMFWSVFSPFDGNYFEAALVHDYLYSPLSNSAYPTADRLDADQIFLRAMEQLGVGWIARNTIYRAVRIAGWIAYKKPDNL